MEAQFLQRNVLSDDLAQDLPEDALFFALHACGDLNTRMLENISLYKARALALSPCCYHSVSSSFYQPLSFLGKKMNLKLDKNALKLAMLQENPGRPQQLRDRRRSMEWRLAFDLIRQDCLGESDYLAFPSFPRNFLKLTFSEFCQRILDRHEFPFHLPDKNLNSYLPLAKEKLRVIRGLGLVLNIFRRPLELWLVLDRAIFLKEVGMNCQVGQFCSFWDSPRNILLFAER